MIITRNFGRRPRSFAARQRNPHRQRRLLMEVLEERRVLTLDSGELNVWSSNSNSQLMPVATDQQEWIVRLSDVSGAPAEQTAQVSGRLQAAGIPAHVSAHLGLDGLMLVTRTPGQEGLDLQGALEQLAGVQYVEANLEGTAAAILPNDPSLGSQWGLHNLGQAIEGSPSTFDADIDAPEAWDITTGASRVVVGVIDSGIDYTHPELYQSIWLNNAEIPTALRSALTDADGDGTITFRDLNQPGNAALVSDLNGNSYIDGYDVLHNAAWANGNDTDGNGFADDLIGWNFVNNTNNPFDDLGHGTHVAGTIGARADNVTGVAGVSWDSTLMAVKWINQYNFGTGAAAIQAVNYATMMRTRGVNMPVTNNSWFVSPFSQALFDAVKASRDANMLFVASAGNNGSNTDAFPNYPSSFNLDNIVSVAATTQTDGRASFSNFGAASVDLGAPGQNIYSTVTTSLYPSGYLFANGTSMAAPHVSGVAALGFSEYPQATYQEMRDALLLGVDPVNSLANITVTGGRLNAFNTLQMLGTTPTPDAAGDTLLTAQDTLWTGDAPLTVSGKIGDGLFPLRDVDLYKFTIDAAGQVLTALRTTPAGSAGVSTVLRLLAEDGTPLLAVPASLAAKLEYHFPAAGTFYLGVSGANNSTYDPLVGGSGAISNRGDYRIDLSLATPTPDAAGQTLATAQTVDFSTGPLSVTTRIGDGLFPLRDVDLYRFEAAIGQVFIAETSTPSGGTPVSAVLRLFDASGAPLLQAGTGVTTRMEVQLAAGGMYFLGVSALGNATYNPNDSSGPGTPLGTRGDYRLSLTLDTPVADLAGQTLADAQATGLGAGSFSVDAKTGDGLFPMHDVDLYRLDVSAGQGVTAVTSAVAGRPLMTTALRLFNGSGTELAFNRFGNGNYSRLQYVFAEGGTYYVGVSGNADITYDPTTAPAIGGVPVASRGDYHLDLTVETAVLDAAGDSLAAALDITAEAADGSHSITAEIGDNFFAGRDVDLYRLDAAGGQRLTATMLAANGSFVFLIGRLFSSAGVPLASFSGFSATLSNVQFPTDGSYYLGISGWPNTTYNPLVAGSGVSSSAIGGYQLNIAVVTPTPDEGDTIATAVGTGLGVTADSYSHAALIGDGAWGPRDVDLYRFEAEPGEVLQARASRLINGDYLDGHLRVFNSAGVELAANDNYLFSGSSYLEYAFTASGTYYVGVSGSPNGNYNPNVFNSGTFADTGDYQLELSLSVPTADAAGDLLATALATNLGPSSGTYQAAGRIGDGLYLSRDVDLYRFEVTAGQALVASAVIAAGTDSYFTRAVRLFDAAGIELTLDFERLEYFFAASGTYYLGISSSPNYYYDPANVAGRPMSDMGDYRLDLRLLVPTPDAIGDTITTALDTGIAGGRSSYALPTSRIGDGLYLSRDVDMFRFEAQAGAHVTAVASFPAGGTPAALVLTVWDASGNYLAQGYGYGAAVLELPIDARGTYYLGVSVDPNSYYDPNVAGSGFYYGGSSGDYALELSVEKRLAHPTDPVGGGGKAVAQVSGQGQWRHATGLPDGGNQIERTSINAWLDASGVAHGMMSWDDVLNTLPGGGGRGTTGYNWVMQVDRLEVDGNSAYLEGVVIASSYQPGDLGTRVSWTVVDNGPGHLDTIDGTPLFTGNFTIRTAAASSGASWLAANNFTAALPGAADQPHTTLAEACAFDMTDHTLESFAWLLSDVRSDATDSMDWICVATAPHDDAILDAAPWAAVPRASVRAFTIARMDDDESTGALTSTAIDAAIASWLAEIGEREILEESGLSAIS